MKRPPKRKRLTTEDYIQGVLEGNRTVLARTITLIESNVPSHLQQSQEVLKHLLPHTGNSIRVGVTGVPGAGKSTFIEALGLYLLEKGHRLAVLAVDPSSSVSGGSILGDKTRMGNLARSEHSFIRPSPSGGTTGGVARKTREAMLVCEAAGYDVILVETIGVGQSEITVRSMVDFFLLLQIAGGGDELQGIKKGIIELSDAVLVNKADGDNKKRAEAARQDLATALHYLPSFTEGWETRAFTCSALNGEGIADIWKVIETFRKQVIGSGVFERRRQEQTREWLYFLVKEQLQEMFFNHADVRKAWEGLESAVMNGEMPVTAAARELLAVFRKAIPAHGKPLPDSGLPHRSEHVSGTRKSPKQDQEGKNPAL